MDSRSCDQCAIRRVRCTRDMPICSMCKVRGLICTNDRPLKLTKRKKNNLLNSQIQVWRLKKDSPPLSPPPVILSQKKTQFLLPSMNGYFSNCLKKDKIIHLSLYFSNLLSNPNMAYFGNNLISYASIVYRINENDRTIGLNLKEITLNFSSPIFKKALDAYFDFGNHIMILFTRKDFFSRPRSNLLLSAICLLGLHFLNRDAPTKELILSLEASVYKNFFKQLSKFSLDMLQTSLVLVNYCQFSLTSAIHDVFFYKVASTMLYALGLHIPQTQTTQNILLEQEKIIAYNTLKFAEGFFYDSLHLPNFTGCQASFSPLVVQLLDTSVSNNHDILDFCEIVLNDVYRLLTQGKYLLSWIRGIVSAREEPSIVIKQKITAALDYFYKVHDKCNAVFHKFHSKFDSHFPHLRKDTEPYQLIITQLITITVRDFYLLGTQLDPDPSLPSSLSPKFDVNDTFYSKYLHMSQSVILINIKIGVNYFYFFRLIFQEQALICLSRHLKSFPESTSVSPQLLKMGEDLLVGIVSLPVHKHKINSFEGSLMPFMDQI